MSGRIEIKFYCAERASDRDAQHLLAGDFLFADRLPRDVSGERLLIESPTAAKQGDAALKSEIMPVVSRIPSGNFSQDEVPSHTCTIVVGPKLTSPYER